MDEASWPEVLRRCASLRSFQTQSNPSETHLKPKPIQTEVERGQGSSLSVCACTCTRGLWLVIQACPQRLPSMWKSEAGSTLLMKLLESFSFLVNKPLESQVSAVWQQQPRFSPACQPALKETRLRGSRQVRRIDCFCPVALLSLGCNFITILNQVLSTCTSVHIGQLPSCSACQDILGDHRQHRYILPCEPCQLKHAHAKACQLQAPAGPFRETTPMPALIPSGMDHRILGGGRGSAPATLRQQPTQPRHATTAFMHYVLVHGCLHVSWLSASCTRTYWPLPAKDHPISPPNAKKK